MLLDFIDEAKKGPVTHRARDFETTNPGLLPYPYPALTQHCVHVYRPSEVEGGFLYAIYLEIFYLYANPETHSFSPPLTLNLYC